MTRGECAAVHEGVAAALASLEEKIDHWGQAHDDKLKELNDSVGKNTTFRIQSKAVYGAIAFAWATMMIPIAAIAVSVLK